MATTVGEIVVDIRAKFEKLQSDINSAKGTIKGFADNVRGMTTLVEGYFAALGGRAIVDFVANTIEGVAALKDLAEQTGASVEGLSALKSVARLSGTDIGTVAAAMNKLSKSLVDSSEDSKGAAQALKALGIDFNSFIKMSPDEQMKAVAAAMAGFEDGAGKSAAAMMLWGKTGAQLMPFINDLGENLDVAAKVTTEQAAAADDLTKQWGRVQASGDAWKKELALGMIPALNDTTRAVLGVINGAGGLREQVAALNADGSIDRWTRNAITGTTYVVDAFEYVYRAIKSVGLILAGTAAGVVTFLESMGEVSQNLRSGNFVAAYDAMTAGTVKMKIVTDGLGDSLAETWGEETMGAKMRGRMADIQAAGAVTEAAKPKLDLTVVAKANGAALDKEHEKVIKVIAALEDELATVGKDKVEKSALQKLREAGAAASDKERAQIDRLVRAIDQEEKFTQMVKDGKEAQAKAEKALDDQRQKELNTILEAIEKEDTRIRTLGLSRSQVEEMTLAEMRNTLEKQRNTDGMEKDIEATERRIAAQERLVAKLKDGEIADADRKAADDAAKAWERASQQIEQALTDSLMRGFESGKSIFVSLRDYLVNLFKTTVVRFGVQAIMGSLGMGAAGSAAASAGGSAGGNFLMSAAGNMASSALGSIGSGIAGIGGNLMGGLGGWFGAMAEQGIIGGTLASLDAGMVAAGAGNISGAIGSLLGPIGAVVAVVGLLASVLDKHGGPKVGGGAWSTGEDFFPSDYTEHQATDQMRTTVRALQTSLDKQITLLGGRAGATIGMGYSADPAGDSNTFMNSAVRNAAGVEVWRNVHGDVERNDQALQAALVSESQRVVLAALQNSGVDQAVLDVIGSTDLKAASDEVIASVYNQVQALAAVAQAFDGLAYTFPQLADLSLTAEANITKFAGGIEALSSKLSYFYSNFYTDAERNAKAIDTLNGQFSAMGLSVAANKDAFRALVESQDLTTSAGQATYAALLELAPAFNAVTQALGDAAAQTIIGQGASDAAVAAGQQWWSQYAEQTTTAQNSTTAAVDSLATVVTDGADRTVAAINRLTDTVASGRSSELVSIGNDGG